MLASLLFFIVISSGCVSLVAFTGRKYEEALPVSCMTIVFVMFVCGLLNILPASFPVVCALSAASCLSALFYILKSDRKQRFTDFIKAFFTPAFFLFFVFFVYVLLLNKGRLFYFEDEFTHWGDVVKAMLETGTLSTGPNTRSVFASYPPAMALFQYLLQRLNLFVNPGIIFDESLTFVAYQLLMAAFMLPFFAGHDYRRVYPYILFAAALVSPLIFFDTAYTSIYIDPFLAVVCASGLAAVLSGKCSETWYRAYVFMCAAMLVLTKDVGAMLAVFLLAVCAVMVFGTKNCGFTKGKILRFVGIAAISVALPYLLWKLNIKLSGAPVAFDGKVDIGIMINAFLGRDGSYRSQLTDTFYNYIIGVSSSVSFLGTPLTFLMSFVFLIAALFIVCRLHMSKHPEKSFAYNAFFVIIAAEFVIYVIGLLVAYMFKYSEYEAVRFASMGRYVSIPSLSITLCCLLSSLELLRTTKKDSSIVAVLIVCLVLSLVPGESLKGLISRESIGQANEARYHYNNIQASFDELTGGGEYRIYLISQEDAGGDYWIPRFAFRPSVIESPLSWSFGPQYTFRPNDDQSRLCSAEEWREVLLSGYDYVLIININDYFLENYSSLFDNPDDIHRRSLFSVNHETGLLEYCGAL